MICLKTIVRTTCIALLAVCSVSCGFWSEDEPAPPTDASRTPATRAASPGDESTPTTPPATPTTDQTTAMNTDKAPPSKPDTPPARASQIKKAPPVAAAPAAAAAAFSADPSKLDAKAPERFKVKFETTKGDVIIDVTRAWSPRGADRFHSLVATGYFTDVAFFRVIEGFMAQFGIHGDPKINKVMMDANIRDDPVMQRNARGTVTFAKTGRPHSRSVQFFINFGDNFGLDRQGFSPFGQVSSGMEIVDSIYSGYGEGAPRGRGPDQGRVQSQGNAYLKKEFPRLDYIKRATVLK